MSWQDTILSFWQERRDTRPHNPVNGFMKNSDFVRLIKNLDDLLHAFEILKSVKQHVPEIFLQTRPPYMSREGPQWEPCHTGYVALLEGVLEDVPGVTMVTDEEIAELWLRNPSLTQLNHPSLRQAIESRWKYERARALRRKQREFMDVFQHDVIAAALHPKRVEYILTHYDFEGLMATFDG
jgi:hypothetical protein